MQDALKSIREKEIREERIQKMTKTGKSGKKRKERPKERNCRYRTEPNWNPNHKCPVSKSIRHNYNKKGILQKPANFNTDNNNKLVNYGTRRDRRK